MLPDPRSYSSTLGFNQHLGRHGRAGLKGLFPCCLTMTNFISRTGFFRERETEAEGERPPVGPQWSSLYKGVVPLHIWGGECCTEPWFTDSPAACNVCSEEETVFLVCMECEGLLPLHQYLKQLLLRFWLHFSPTILVFGQGVGRADREGGISLSVCSWAWPRWPFAGPGSGRSMVTPSSGPTSVLACPCRGNTQCPWGLWSYLPRAVGRERCR